MLQHLRPLNLSSSKSSPDLSLSVSVLDLSSSALVSVFDCVFAPISSLIQLLSVTPYSRFYIDRLFSPSLSRYSETQLCLLSSPSLSRFYDPT